MLEQAQRVPGILSQDAVHRAQGVHGTVRDIGQVSNRGADKIQTCFHKSQHTRSRLDCRG